MFSKVVSVAPEPPKLAVIAPTRLAVGAKSRGTVKFKNPLPVKMENVVVTVECDGLLRGELHGGCFTCVLPRSPLAMYMYILLR